MGRRKLIEMIEITLNADAFEVEAYLKRFTVLKVYIVSCNCLRIRFDALTITAKKVCKLVQQATNKDHRSRKRNIISIKEINTAA